jgi:hypothetical protein
LRLRLYHGFTCYGFGGSTIEYRSDDLTDGTARSDVEVFSIALEPVAEHCRRLAGFPELLKCLLK